MTDERATRPEDELPGPRQGRAVGMDMRGQAVAAVVRGGISGRAAARQFGLAPATVRRWVKQFREQGHVRPGKQGGTSVSRIEPERERILRILAAKPELTVQGLRDALAGEGLSFSASTVHKFLKRHRLQRKHRLPRRRRRGRKA